MKKIYHPSILEKIFNVFSGKNYDKTISLLDILLEIL